MSLLTIETKYTKLEDIPREEWGPVFWYMIHILAYNFHPKFADEYTTFIYEYINILPCPICKNHFKDLLKNMAPRTRNREDLIDWSIIVHNLVNKRLDKKIYTRSETDLLYEVIRYQRIIDFLEYLQLFIKIDPTLARKASTIKMIKVFVKIIPCDHCREIIQKYGRNNSITANNIVDYIEKVVEVLKTN
jgi:hypothetical protein